MSDIHYIYGVWKNPNVKVFNKPQHLTDQKHVNYLPWIYTQVAQFILCMTFLMYIATIQHLNYCRQESKQESKKNNLQFTFLTHHHHHHHQSLNSEGRWTGKSSMGSTIMRSPTFITFMVSEKITLLKFLCHACQLPGPALTPFFIQVKNSCLDQHWSLQRLIFHSSQKQLPGPALIITKTHFSFKSKTVTLRQILFDYLFRPLFFFKC